MKKIVILFLGIVFSTSGILFAQRTTANEDSNYAEVRLTANMHCQDCAIKIKKQLAFTKGVKFASADYETKVIYVKYRKDKTSVDNIIKSLEEIGYEAKVYTPTYSNTRKTCCSGASNSSGCSSTTKSSCSSSKSDKSEEK